MNVPESNKRIHLTCSNYCQAKNSPIIEIKHLESGQTQHITTKSIGISILLKGVINCSTGTIKNRQINPGTMLCFPAKHTYKFEVLEECSYIVFKLDRGLTFCANFSLEQLDKVEIEKTENDICTLKINSVMEAYLSQLSQLLNNELFCDFLLELKLREFLYLLRNYYPAQELKTFFSPILCEDFLFSEKVRKIYYPKITVSDMASKMNYSISGFEKRFKKVFKLSPLEWINTQLAIAISHELNCSTKTFSELSYEFGFSSPSHFHNFCKKSLKDTPGNIRRKI